MGANIDNPPEEFIIEEKLKNTQVCNLLFLGVDWERKGGEIAFNTLKELNRKGVHTTLTVCGCIPPKEFSDSNMKIFPFLDKNKDDDYKIFIQILRKSHFLILPTRAECFGIVFCEASAFGIPSITTDTGGISNAVENGINGYRLPLDSSYLEYADKIYKLFINPDEYEKIVR